MPTYEYRCPEGHEFERFYRKISDAASELPCPTCGKLAERRLSGGAGLVFKGSGFYLTDYGKNAHRKAGDEKPAGNSSSETKSAGPKPDAKSESKSGDSSSKPESKSSESKSSASPSSGSGSSGKSDT